MSCQPAQHIQIHPFRSVGAGRVRRLFIPAGNFRKHIITSCSSAGRSFILAAAQYGATARPLESEVKISQRQELRGGKFGGKSFEAEISREEAEIFGERTSGEKDLEAEISQQKG